MRLICSILALTSGSVCWIIDDAPVRIAMIIATGLFLILAMITQLRREHDAKRQRWETH